MSNKEIRITCSGHTTIDLAKLVPLQGNLKSLANEDYQRLKGQILELGFSEPVTVWNYRKKHYIINGHQRTRVATRMVQEEGFTCPPVPINLVEAKNMAEAKRKILSLTSQYGKIEKDGLYEFLQSSDISHDELHERFRFPEVDIAAFTEEFYVDVDPNDDLDMANLEVENENIDPDQLSSLSDTDNVSHVKMVQLFFNEDTHEDFMQMAAVLAKDYETENITDTVAEAVRIAHEKARQSM